MSLELSGKVTKILAPQTFNSGKTKRTFVIQTNGQYPQTIPFDVWGEDKFGQWGITVGREANVSFDLRGSEYNGKYFVNANAWKVTPLDANANAGTQHPQPQVQAPAPQPAPAQDDSQLPF